MEQFCLDDPFFYKDQFGAAPLPSISAIKFLSSMPSVSISPVNTVPNTIDVGIKGEAHTAASAIVERLNDDRGCDYAAYKVEHPKDDFVVLRVKGNSKAAKDVLRGSIASIIKDIDDLISQIKK